MCGYAQRDLIVPAEGRSTGVETDSACQAWCDEVISRIHSETAAVPDQRLVEDGAPFRTLPSLRPPLRRGVSRRVDLEFEVCQ